MKRILILTVMFFIFLPATSFTQDKEAEARKLYLQASRSVRAEEYKKAERLLNQILSDYIDTEIALKADDLLSSIGDKLKAENLPTTPGFYVLTKARELIKLEKTILKQGTYGGRYTGWVHLDPEKVELVDLFADEIDRFYVYRPKAELSQIDWSTLAREQVAEGQQASNNWALLDNWYVPTEQGRFANDDVVFNEPKNGLFEFIFSNFSPVYNITVALNDASGYVGLINIQPRIAFTMYPLTGLWRRNEITNTYNIIRPLRSKYPNKPELYLFEGFALYKLDYLDKAVPNRAKQIALDGLALEMESATALPYVFDHLRSLLLQCRMDSVILNNMPLEGDTEDQLKGKLENLSIHYDENTMDLVNANFRWRNTLAATHAALGDFKTALIHCEFSERAFKDFGPKGKSWLGGRIGFQTRADVQAERNLLANFHIQRALNDYSNEHKKLTEKYKKYVQSELILAEVERDYINGTGNAKSGLKLVNKARKKDKNNEHVYLLRAKLYEKLGDKKKMEKAMKEAEKAKRNKNKDITKLTEKTARK